MKKKLIALVLMFAFAFPFTAQAESAIPAVPAYASVSATSPGPGTDSMAEAISKGKITNNSVIANMDRPYAGGAAVAKETTSSQEAWEDRIVSIGAGSGGVSGGDSIGGSPA
ncbi:MAG: hypothetical protein KAR42_15695 [candidate division Zixibacteria bacterium]|nr:hypothetical protein [candidate division Zixibacteria bacterium]